MSPYWGLLSLAWMAAQVLGLNMQIDQLYSESFVPNDIIISYSLENRATINYNLTVKMHFPGKLLMQIFVRRLDDVPGGTNTFEMLKLKNLDFCKSLESMRNMTIDDFQSESLIPPTFLISCPLMPGFYYVDRGFFDDSLFPWPIKDGRYFLLFELVQVYEEVTRLLNCKLRFSKKIPETKLESKNNGDSMEHETNDKPEDNFDGF
ncbi:uncharacterized protein Dvir_GJ12213 [Drosophila virilis]|uniref:Uncharacterized protein n=2 Tax=Drosophila virilis TaxID=7244 RepID=B4LFH4_DROVI|nr:uncharacterized protein LOC6624122 [Drosophila virilis]EDW69272.2 uncharacterized protein Dvir_GJ12213 [Drosophila virilis]